MDVCATNILGVLSEKLCVSAVKKDNRQDRKEVAKIAKKVV